MFSDLGILFGVLGRFLWSLVSRRGVVVRVGGVLGGIVVGVFVF